MSKNVRRKPKQPEPAPITIVEPEQSQAAHLENTEQDTCRESETGDENIEFSNATESTTPHQVSGNMNLRAFWNSLPTDIYIRLTGIFCILCSILLLLAISSHFFYWWSDYDVVQQMHSSGVWENSDFRVRNLGGRLGAFIASGLVNSGFGLASFIFPIIIAMIGIQILKIKSFNWIKTFFHSAFFLLWISILMGSIFRNGGQFILGGQIGIHTSAYIKGLLGIAGLVSILGFSLLAYLMLNYKLRGIRIPSLNSFRNKRNRKPENPIQPVNPIQSALPSENIVTPQPEDHPKNNGAPSAPSSPNSLSDTFDDFGMTLTTRMGLTQSHPSTENTNTFPRQSNDFATEGPQFATEGPQFATEGPQEENLTTFEIHLPQTASWNQPALSQEHPISDTSTLGQNPGDNLDDSISRTQPIRINIHDIDSFKALASGAVLSNANLDTGSSVTPIPNRTDGGNHNHGLTMEKKAASPIVLPDFSIPEKKAGSDNFPEPGTFPKPISGFQAQPYPSPAETSMEEKHTETAPAPTQVQTSPSNTSETANLGGMEITDTRNIQEFSTDTKVKAQEHFGLDTPFNPRLELSDYRFPGIDLLEDFGDQSQKLEDMKAELSDNKAKIEETLQNYNISIDKISATIGPTVTLYEIVPAAGIRISKIKNLEDDIALSLSALGIRIIAPIPGRGTIGIEVPNSKKQIVPMRDMLTSEKFRHNDMALPVALGKTISNEVYVTDLAKMPHLLVAGATGQGKSVGLNAIIGSLLYSKHPAELKFVMVDPKKVELSLFNKIERHYLAKLPDSEDAIITDTRKVVRTLNSLCIEMDARYDLLKDAGAKNIKEYNKKFIERRLNPEEGHRFLPYIVLIIDEFADLIMTAGKEVETPIARLAQLARAIGIHLVIATQRPSVNIITGIIKANFPARIAFKVSQKIDSRTILDASGADQLIGRGDMLIQLGDGLTRLQCAYIDTPEIERITEFIGSQRGYPTAYMLPECPDENGSDSGKAEIDNDEWDSMFKDAAELVVSTQQGSTSMLQRKFKLGYNRAGRIMDQLESAGIVGPFDGKKTREVKIKDPMALEIIYKNLNI